VTDDVNRDVTGTKDYVRVILVWVLVLAALFGLQAYFS
jgi:hypothetical protein